MSYRKANNAGRTEDDRCQISASSGHKADVSVSVKIVTLAVPSTTHPTAGINSSSPRGLEDLQRAAPPVSYLLAFVHAGCGGLAIASLLHFSVIQTYRRKIDPTLDPVPGSQLTPVFSYVFTIGFITLCSLYHDLAKTL